MSLVYVCLDLTVGSRTGLRSVQITRHVKQVQYVGLQQHNIFLASLYA